MSDPERVRQRSGNLLPEEQAAGTDDAEAQAAAILGDSDARQTYAQSTPDLRIEHRRSGETVDTDPDPGSDPDLGSDPDPDSDQDLDSDPDPGTGTGTPAG